MQTLDSHRSTKTSFFAESTFTVLCNCRANLITMATPHTLLNYTSLPPLSHSPPTPFCSICFVRLRLIWVTCALWFARTQSSHAPHPQPSLSSPPPAHSSIKCWQLATCLWACGRVGVAASIVLLAAICIILFFSLTFNWKFGKMRGKRLQRKVASKLLQLQVCGAAGRDKWRGGKCTTAAAATLINDSTWLWSRFRASTKDQRLNVC